MDEGLRIYVDRLRTQGVEQIHETVPPGFMDVQEKELRFADLVMISGEAYLAQDELVLKLLAKTRARMPCAICNQEVPVDIQAQIMHMEPALGLKRGVYDMSPLVREALLLEVPLVAECNEGHCPGRKEIEQYLRTKKKVDQGTGEGYRPFADLDQE